MRKDRANKKKQDIGKDVKGNNEDTISITESKKENFKKNIVVVNSDNTTPASTISENKVRMYNERRKLQDREQEEKDKYIKTVLKIQKGKTQEELEEDKNVEEFFKAVKEKTESNLREQEDKSER